MNDVGNGCTWMMIGSEFERLYLGKAEEDMEVLRRFRSNFR